MVCSQFFGTLDIICCFFPTLLKNIRLDCYFSEGNRLSTSNKIVAEKIWPGTGVAGRSFLKMHGLRNHFIIVDGRDEPFHPNLDEIVQICNAQVGVGGEQLLIIEPPSKRGLEKKTHAFMRILNIDGREVGACGNAARCVAYLLLEETQSDHIILETASGILECHRGEGLTVSVNMGQISMDWRDMPLAEEQDMNRLPIKNGPLKYPVGLYIGTPHVVFFVDELSAINMENVAPPVQENPLFLEQVNVGVAEIIDEDNMRLAVYERPGILTSACGSGACVAVYAALRLGLIKSKMITVEMQAGSVSIDIQADNSVLMTGPVAYCFSGQLLTI